MDRELAEMATKRYASEKCCREMEVKALLVGASGERLAKLGEAAVRRALTEMSSSQELGKQIASMSQEMQKKVGDEGSGWQGSEFAMGCGTSSVNRA